MSWNHTGLRTWYDWDDKGHLGSHLLISLPPPCSTRLLWLKVQAAAAESGARDSFLVPAPELQAEVLALEFSGSEAGKGVLARLTDGYLPVLVWL